ncbi:MAG TPA: class I SAM-dependent methyltransferase [Planctomycetota bacterium]|nr:class I SAM-dependent methyltransferase [Planctomycetota bacterium]
MIAAAYETRQGWPPETSVPVARHLLDQAPRARSAAFFGCASGVNDAVPFAGLAPGVRVLASDVDPDLLRALRERVRFLPNVEVRKIDVLQDLRDVAPADLVGIFFVVHRLPRWEDVVAPLAAAVAPGGRLFTSEFAGPSGLIHLANEEGGTGSDPVSRLLRRYHALRREPFAPRLRTSRMRPFLDALGRRLRPEGFRDFYWPRTLSVGEVLELIADAAYAPFHGRADLERLRAEFEAERDERVELIETIRVHGFARD